MPCTGTCYCGAIILETSDQPLQMGYCHCENCRKYSGAPLASFALWKTDQVKITQGEELMGTFASSEMSNRLYCIECGTHLAVDHPALGFIDIRTPLEGLTFKPSVHLNYDEKFVAIRDGLPKLRDFPKEIGGSGETLPE